MPLPPESPREPIANALAILQHARKLFPAGYALSDEEYESVTRLLASAVELLDKQGRDS